MIFAVKTRVAILDRDNSNRLENENVSWLAIIWNRMVRILRTHAFKIDVDHIFNTAANTSTRNSDNNIVQGE